MGVQSFRDDDSDDVGLSNRELERTFRGLQDLDDSDDDTEFVSDEKDLEIDEESEKNYIISDGQY